MSAEAAHQELLQYVSKHISLTDQEAEIFLSNFEAKSFKKNDFIGKQGDIPRVQNFIISGGARMYLIDDKGDEHTIQFGVENWWLGDLGNFITQTPADYNIQCFEATQVLQLSYTNLQKLYGTIPKLERFYRIIIQNAYVSAQRRIVNKTRLSATERYLDFRNKYPHLEQRVPQYMIASYLGITKEFLSKLRRQLMQA